MSDDDYNPSDRSHSAAAEEEDGNLVIPYADPPSDSEDSASGVPTIIKTV